MKYLKKYESMHHFIDKNTENIQIFCRQNSILEYKINDDGSIDILEDCNILNYNYFGLVKINIVEGNFTLTDHTGNDLVGCPKEVTGNFFYYVRSVGKDVKLERIYNLYGCPENIGGNLFIRKTNLKSLEYFPKYVGGRIDISDNKLETLDAIKDFGFNDKRIECYDNNLYDLCGIQVNNYYSNPIYKLIGIIVRNIVASNMNVDNMSKELIERFEEFDIISKENDGYYIDELNLDKLCDFYNVDLGEMLTWKVNDNHNLKTKKDHLMFKIVDIGYKIK